MSEHAVSGLPWPRRGVAIVAISAGSLMLMTDASIAAVVLPTLAEAMGIDSSRAVLVVTVYQLILAMTLMPLAALGDRIGQRRLFRAGLVLHSVGAALCFLADDLTALILARSLQALGTASAMSVVFGLLRLVYPAAQLGQGLAINTIANASGTALAPVAGGLVLSVASWQWVFSAAVPFSLLCLLLSRALPEPEPHSQPFDLPGAGFCALTFGLLIAGMEMATHGPHGWLGGMLLGAAVVSAVLLVRCERGRDHPVLPVDLLRQPDLALVVLSNFIAVLGSMTLLLYAPFLLQDELGYSAGATGGLLASYAMASMVCAPLAGYLSDRLPVPLLCLSGLGVSLLGLWTLVLLPADAGSFGIMWRLWLCGGGFGLFFSPAARLVIGTAPASRAAAAGSLQTTVRMLGQALGATLLAALLASPLGEGTRPMAVSMALVVVATAVFLLHLKARP
ncbi:MFS transporter [Mangrovimicrobium sediminis]|uniref:MFS transporter n=1 Tax=Mangrovimicrobium sediminis TaxID=2562682 RepID=A0A4Z0LZF9_9GAMM|nr:MFS transporter [Haliea sp. SAOS-164]TGD72576.1 MFS transporter [Haliea sp. SAOS-164]